MTISIPKTRLGKTNLMVSRIGCGLIRIGRKWGIDAPNEPSLPDRVTAFNFLRGATELGINFFDTASSYGTSEEILSNFIKKYKTLAKDMIIATKCGDNLRPDGTSYRDYSLKAIRISVENSLRLLGGHIHILQLHSITEETLDQEDTLRFLEDLRKSGKVQFLGITCTYPPSAVTKAIKTGMFFTVQVPYNPIFRNMESVIQLASDRNIGVITNRPLATGLFSSKIDFASQEEQAKVEKFGLSKSELARFAWEFSLNNPYIDVVLTGTRNLNRLKENLSFLKIKDEKG